VIKIYEGVAEKGSSDWLRLQVYFQPLDKRQYEVYIVGVHHL